MRSTAWAVKVRRCSRLDFREDETNLDGVWELFLVENVLFPADPVKWEVDGHVCKTGLFGVKKPFPAVRQLFLYESLGSNMR